MAITVYGSRLSSCTRRVLMMLTELNLDYTLSDIDLQKGEQKARTTNPAYMQEHHPIGLIPTIVDDGFQLFESRAICEYLLAKYGRDHELYRHGRDETPESIGQFSQAISMEYSYFQPTIFGLAFEFMFKQFSGQQDTAPDAAVVARLRSTLTSLLDYYDKILGTRDYLGGDTFTLVDLYHLPWVPYFAQLGLESEIESRPNLEAWTKRAFARPSWQVVNK